MCYTIISNELGDGNLNQVATITISYIYIYILYYILYIILYIIYYIYILYYIPIITILFVLSPLCILNADKPSNGPQRKIFPVLFLLISPVLPIVADIKPTYTPTNSNKLTISILLKCAQQPTNNHLDILQGSIDPILQYSSRSIVGHQSPELNPYDSRDISIATCFMVSLITSLFSIAEIPRSLRRSINP